MRSEKCAVCLAPPHVSVSCSPGRKGTRVPFGLEFHINTVEPATGEPAKRCPRCGTPAGGYHHAHCMVDECPACQGAAWKCGCVGNRLRMLKTSMSGNTDPVILRP